MTRLGTRVCSTVDAAASPELFCTTHEDWLSPTYFSTQDPSSTRPGSSVRYSAKCKSCTNAERKLANEGLSYSEAALRVKQERAGASSFAGSLHRARHTKGQPSKVAKPLSTKEREERREQREEAEGTPSMCYLVGVEGDNSAVKIGYSTNVYRRMAQYQAGNPRKLKVLALLPGGQAKEQELHRKFMKYHSDEFVGEWFRLGPAIMNEFAAGKVKN